MPNMSYCRFENTLTDLKDCLRALENRDVSSASERKRAKDMLFEMAEFLQDTDIINEFDDDVISNIIDECKENTDND